MNQTVTAQLRVILFDGVCNLCNSSVQFVLKHEKKPTFHFGSIQSAAGKQLLNECGFPPGYDRGKVYSGSTAALKIGKTLTFPWSLLSSLGLLIPIWIRDRVYDQIAKRRYQWFGKRDVCIVPDADLKSRFL